MPMRPIFVGAIAVLVAVSARAERERALQAADAPGAPILALDLTRPPEALRLAHGVRATEAGLEFTSARQYAEIALSRRLDGIPALSVGGWFQPRRAGEQAFVCRGEPQVAPLGERLFPPEEDWVNFLLGTDQHGFFLGTIHGNGRMPFPLVTLDAVPINAWSQLVVVKDEDGHHHFYRNGTLVHTDRDSEHSGVARPFRDDAPGEPLRLAMPMGGLMGEVWVVPRALSADEVRQDFLNKRDRYPPALPAEPVPLRTMDAHFDPSLWPEPITADSWPETRERIRRGVLEVLGPFPDEADKVPLTPILLNEEDCGSYLRRTVTIQVQPDDRMPAYLLIPKDREGPVPAVICFYGTTAGAGKATTVGLSGPRPGTPPERNRAFAIDVVEAGLIAFAPDYLRDGERIAPGRAPYDTTDFYQTFPDWSLVGKDIWDTSRAIDYLQTLDIVDPDRIGMMGHSYGGHTTIFAAALEPRIQVAVANGPVSDFRHHGLHWGVPKGARNSQSLPGMRPFVLDHTLPIPVEFYEWTALIAPRPLWVGQAVGERRPREEENHAAVRQVYEALGVGDRVHYVWYAGDHDFPPVARGAAVDWLRRWFGRL